MATPVFDPTAHPALTDLGAHLRGLAGDASYQAGRDYLRKGRVRQGAVAGTTAYATVTGSSEYRVSVAFGGEPSQVKVTCTCPAARRNKYCKHVVAVATALLERPADFVIGEAPPEVLAPPRRAARAAGGSAGRPRAAKAAGPTPEQLRAAGLETVDRLLAELAEGGLMSLGPDKLALLAGAGDLVRALKLRRLGNLLLRLQRAAEQGQPGRSGPRRSPGLSGSPGTAPGLDERSFARLLADLWLTRQATGAALNGRAQLDGAAAEDLLGKTWRDEDLERVGGLELMEVGFQREDDGEFRIETSYLGDLATGTLYAERQITPIRLSTAAKPRHLHRLLVDDAGLYPGGPGSAPRRLKLLRAQRAPLSVSDVARWLARVPDTVAALRHALVTHLATPFGPPEVAIAIRPAALLTYTSQTSQDRAARIAVQPVAADTEGVRLALECPSRWLERLVPLLPSAGSYALVGLLRLAGTEDASAGSGLVLRCLSAVSPGFGGANGPVISDE